MIKIEKKEAVRVNITVDIWGQIFDINVNPFYDIEELDGFKESEKITQLVNEIEGINSIYNKTGNRQKVDKAIKKIQEKINKLKIEVLELYSRPIEYFVNRFQTDNVLLDHLKLLIKADESFWVLLNELNHKDKLDLFHQIKQSAIEIEAGKSKS